MMLRVEQGKGQRDRDVMLSPQLLELLREWWKAARPRVWLFPGQNPINPVTPRQLNRAVTVAKDLAGISKRVSPHTLRAQPGVCDPPARTGRRHSRDPGVARAREARDDGALHPRRRQHGPRHQESAGPARRQADEENAARLTRPRAAASPGGRRRLSRPRGGVARGQRRSRQPRPVEGHVGDRDLSHGRARRTRRALRGLRARADRLQFLPQPALPEVSGRGGAANGSKTARPSCCRFPTTTSSSPCRRRSAPSPSRTRPPSTTSCSGPPPRR